MIDYSLILSYHYTGKEWATQNAHDYDSLIWLDSSPKPSKFELDELWDSTKIMMNNEIVDVNRREAYIVEADPLFFKVQCGEATIEEWQAKRTEIKNRYPKNS